MARTSIQELAPLLSIIAERSTPAALATGLELPSRSDSAVTGPYSAACIFYGLEPKHTLKNSKLRSHVPAATILEDLSQVAFVSTKTATRTIRSISVRALSLMLDLLYSFASQKIILDVTLEWNADEWLANMLSAVEGEVCRIPSGARRSGSMTICSMQRSWKSTGLCPSSSRCKRRPA